MKLRTLVKISITTSVALLCTAFAVFSFFKLSAAENKAEFDLYTLVPSTAVAILETDNMTALVQEIDKLGCSKDNHFLHISKVFSCLKKHLYTLLEDTPHGLSRQMSKVLLSFHEPDNDRNQVLYCALGSGDYELIGKFIKKYCSSTFPSKMFEYKGEEIRIYPLPDDDFLACYCTSDFLVVSYQKRLVEEVIDARLSGESLLADASFSGMCASGKKNVSATIYTRMNSLDMGKMTNGVHPQTALGGWTEFDMKLHGDAIYFSGVNHDTDTCLTFMNMLRRQQALEGFPGEILPSSTFFFSQRSITDLQSMLDFSGADRVAEGMVHTDSLEVYDDAFLAYLKENVQHDIMTCLFAYNDTVSRPAMVASLPVRDVIRAERMLKVLINNASREKKDNAVPAITLCYTSLRTYPLYSLPYNTLFTQLTSVAPPALHTYACFYKGRLLLAPDAESLSGYLHSLDKGEVLDGTPEYKESVIGLSDVYNFMLVSDLGYMFTQPESYVRLLPNFFFRNSDFFRHFVLSAQFSCTDGIVYPNVVLQYKEN
ncbi:DUF3352 domain-containing protein [Bacteroides sp.]